MEYPFIMDGERRGSLSIEQDGLFTVFEIWAEQTEGLLRVSVYGEGREAYLGIMAPKSGGLYFKRRLSRREMENFPRKIDYAGETGHGDESSREVRPSPPTTPQDDEDGLVWYKKADGTLTAFDGKSRVIAIPSKLRSAPRAAVLRTIEGQEYILFRY